MKTFSWRNGRWILAWQTNGMQPIPFLDASCLLGFLFEGNTKQGAVVHGNHIIFPSNLFTCCLHHVLVSCDLQGLSLWLEGEFDGIGFINC